MKVRVKPSGPLIVDRWQDVTYAALWAIYSAWGFVILASGGTPLRHLAPGWYQDVWSVAIAVLSAVACLSAVSLFFHNKISFVTKKMIERSAVIALGSFISIYPGIALFAAIGGGDAATFGQAVIGTSFIVFPAYRIYQLGQRIKAYKQANEELTHGN